MLNFLPISSFFSRNQLRLGKSARKDRSIMSTGVKHRSDSIQATDYVASDCIVLYCWI